MAVSRFTLSAKADKATKEQEVLVRFTHSGINLRGKTGIHTLPEYWDAGAGAIKIPSFRTRESLDPTKYELKAALQEKASTLQNLAVHISKAFTEATLSQKPIGKDWLKETISSFYSPAEEEGEAAAPADIWDTFDEYIRTHRMSEGRQRRMKVVARALKRFSLYTKQNLTLDNLTKDSLDAFSDFLANEHIYAQKAQYAEILAGAPESKQPAMRGGNTLHSLLRAFCSFIHWANKQGHTENDPFKNYSIIPEVYGTPYYITDEERKHIFATDLSKRPALAVQRDIFIFQCLVGCRVSDLKKLTKSSVINGAIEYIPQKTKEARLNVIRVPLNETAKQILERYASKEGDALLPFISDQKYNDAIKEIFTIAGVTRLVTTINPITRQEEQRPINELASSHMARRAFVGNLYKKVKDPNLVGQLSGHAEGSKAFVRYRQIDEGMKKELVSLLD